MQGGKNGPRRWETRVNEVWQAPLVVEMDRIARERQTREDFVLDTYKKCGSDDDDGDDDDRKGLGAGLEWRREAGGQTEMETSFGNGGLGAGVCQR